MQASNSLEKACALIAQQFKNQKALVSDIELEIQKNLGNTVFEILKEKSLIKIESERAYLSETGEQLARLNLEKKQLGTQLAKEVLQLAEEPCQQISQLIETHLEPQGLLQLRKVLGKDFKEPHLACLEQAEVGVWYTVRMAEMINPEIDQKLFEFKIQPGQLIKLTQKFPTFIVQTETTQIAIDKILSSKIYIEKN